MFYSAAAVAVLLIHLGYILFVLAGGALALRHRWIVAIHVPAALWGFVVEWTGRDCPLTAIENFFLTKAGHVGYAESFVEHYLVPIIYPAALTREVQIVLAAAVVIINLATYGWLFVYRPVRGRAPRTRSAGQ